MYNCNIGEQSRAIAKDILKLHKEIVSVVPVLLGVS